MTTLFSDSFTGNAGSLSTHDAGWALITGYSTELYLYSDVLRTTDSAPTASYGYRYSSVVPSSADYSVSVDLILNTLITTGTTSAGVVGRCSSSAATFYIAYLDVQGGLWKLAKRISGTETILNSVSATVSAGTTRRIKLVMSGNQISMYVDDTLIIGPITDSSITVAGYAGLRRYDTTPTTATTGVHYDNFSLDTLTTSTTAQITATTDDAVFSGAAAGYVASASAQITATTADATFSGGAVGQVAAGSLTTDIMVNNAGTVLSSVGVVYEWRVGTGIGVAPSSITYGSGTTDSGGRLALSSLVAGTGDLFVASTDRSMVYYQRATVS